MGGKVLFTASTYSHIVNFHLPYLRKFQEEGWTVHAACGGRPMPIPDAEAKTAAGGGAVDGGGYRFGADHEPLGL